MKQLYKLTIKWTNSKPFKIIAVESGGNWYHYTDFGWSQLTNFVLIDSIPTGEYVPVNDEQLGMVTSF